MTELTNPETAPEIDIDAWLDGAKRTERTVTVYGRADLFADIDLLEAEQRTLASIPEGDRAMGGEDGSALQGQIDALIVQMDGSKLVLRVRALIDEETEAIRKDAEKDLKEVLDKAAADARDEALRNCKRADPGMAANDKNSMLRNAAAVAMNATLESETDIRTIAAAIVSPPMDAARVRKMIERIGDKQVNLIKEAYSRAVHEAPRVVLPKSLKPSPSDDGAMSS